MKSHYSEDEIKGRMAELGDFYHNIALPHGIHTAPSQSTPARGRNFDAICDCLPTDLRGKSVLDIGCNAGAFSIEAKRRGAARVVGIDASHKYIAQAKFCADVLNLDIEYQVANVYDYLIASGPFDVVIFVGVLYHLPDPFRIANLIRKVTRHLCILETVGVSEKFREFDEGLIQFPRPKITHSGTIWINKEGLRHIFVDQAHFAEFKVLFDGGRIGALLTV
jgi:2-polyprenyl-3-methyl-5-hydroxy-6-metoxy-1,4-benzoquinol methylase